jgi:hypothetical protein
LPLTLVLSVILWIIATSGGRHVFVKEVLGDAYDSQAEHLLRGDPGVDLDAIRPEAILIGGKPRMYFGPFPAFFRIPLNLIYPAGRGHWSRVSGFWAAEIALFAFAGVVAQSLRASSLSSRSRNWIGNASIASFVFGSPLIFLLGNLSIYNEAIIWGFAWSVAALYFAIRARSATARGLTRPLLGFSFCAAGALLSRATFGAPLVLIAGFLAFRVAREDRAQQLAALLVPLAAGLAFYLLLSYAKFGTWTGEDYAHYINSVHREFAHEHGVFDLRRVPRSLADYFSLRPPAIDRRPPFVKVDRHPYSYPSLYSLPFSETFLPVTWSSSWLLFGACIGILSLFRRNRSDMFDRWAAAALLVQFISILSFFALAQRYAADLYPFLIFCFAVFLRAGPLGWQRIVLVGLSTVSIVVNFLATACWIGSDGNLPQETRAFWNAVGGKTLAAHSQRK